MKMSRTPADPQTYFRHVLPLQFLLSLAQFRIPMPVTDLMVFHNTSFYVCPQCGVTIEREFMRFCDRCGQRLDWNHYKNARIVYPGPHNS